VLDAQFVTKVEYQRGKTRRQFAPSDKPGLMLRIGIEAPHKGHNRIRRRKEIHPPETLFGGMFDDCYPRRPILHGLQRPSRGVA
jgi:hypothetical protein